MPNLTPPSCRLIALQLWSLLLLNRAWVVHSDLTMGYNIEIGKLTSKEAEVSAVAKLSNGLNQQAWWKLANARWHDSAIKRFFAETPLRPAEMDQLAAVSGKSDSWVASKIVNVTEQTDLVLALQNVATITFTMIQSIAGTGKIDASMRTLLFKCVGIRTCKEGYFVPILAVPHESSGNQQQFSSGNQQQFSYATLWLNLTTNFLVNAIPSFIGKLPPATQVPVVPVDVDDSELSIVVNVHDSISQCPSNPAAISYRSLLDASYGLVPGSACIKFGTAQPFKLLVSLALLFDNATDSRDIQLTTIEELFASLQVETSQWEQRPFEECCEEAFLISDIEQDPKSLVLCDNKWCINTNVSNIACSADQKKGSMHRGVQHLRFLHSITTLSQSCSYDGGEPLNMDVVLQRSPTEVSCTMSSANEVCHTIVNAVDFKDTYFSRLRLLSPQSNWSRTNGFNTSEFNQAPHMRDFNANHMCINKLPSQVLSYTSQAAVLNPIQIQARAYLKSFIAEHNIAFTTKNGPATNLANFLALTVSTTISVILAIAGPFTNFLLRRICRIRPLHLDSQQGTVRKVVKVSFQMICNVLLSFSSFLPVWYIAWSEEDREKPFYTWDLGSNDQSISNSNLGPDLQLRIVYLLSATSNYCSDFIVASTKVVCGTCVIVAICSAIRCKQVLDRYTLLQKYDSILAGNGPLTRTDINEDRETIFARALKAIDMTEAEYMHIKTEVNCNENVPMQDLAQPGQPPQGQLEAKLRSYHCHRAAKLRPYHYDRTHSAPAKIVSKENVDSPYESPASALFVDNMRSSSTASPLFVDDNTPLA